MPSTVSALPSPTIAELTAAFVAGFRSAKTRSHYTDGA